MKTTLHYSTFMSAIITTFTANSYTFDFWECLDLQKAKEWAACAFDDCIDIPAKRITKITFIDRETGELLMECEPESEEEDDEGYDDWGYNEDEGFDPYEGCYTYDC